jgi:RNA polymerase sigma-70 factor, ECF subfamily
MCDTMRPAQAWPGLCDHRGGLGSHGGVDIRSDAALVAAVIRGDTDAFGTLLRRHRDAYTRFAVRMLGSHADADDALQSAFLRAYRGIASCREPGRFAGWLYRIVVNECRTYVTRRERRERRIVRDEIALEQALSTENVIDSGTLDEIEQALSQLVAEQREAFLLHHVEEFSYEEMAALTGVGVSALKMRVKRACERLRELLGGMTYAPPGGAHVRAS